MIPRHDERLPEMLRAPIPKRPLPHLPVPQVRHVPCQNQHIAYRLQAPVLNETLILCKLQVQIRCVLYLHNSLFRQSYWTFQPPANLCKVCKDLQKKKQSWKSKQTTHSGSGGNSAVMACSPYIWKCETQISADRGYRYYHERSEIMNRTNGSISSSTLAFSNDAIYSSRRSTGTTIQG